MERMGDRYFTVYMSEVEGLGVRGRLLVKLKDRRRVHEGRREEYMRGRREGRFGPTKELVPEQGELEDLLLWWRGHPLGGSSQREQGVRWRERISIQSNVCIS